jgi:hypothetical protein
MSRSQQRPAGGLNRRGAALLSDWPPKDSTAAPFNNASVATTPALGKSDLEHGEHLRGWREDLIEQARQYREAAQRNVAAALEVGGLAELQLLAVAGHFARRAKELAIRAGRAAR